MRKLFLFLFIFFACVPRKALKEEIKIKKLQNNLRTLYEELSTSEVNGSFTYQSNNISLSGKFKMEKKGNEWIIIVQNPLSPIVMKINEDTLPIRTLLYNSWKDAGLKYKISGNLLTVNFGDSTSLQIKINNSLPSRIWYNNMVAILSYRDHKVKEIRVQSEEGSFKLGMDY